jgi:NAD-dependent dihydropyrimidine dehydrogenase PreA subunit
MRRGDMGELIYLKDVVTLQLNVEKCVGCGMCLIVCPHAVFGMNERHAQVEDRDACMECGACSKNCPAGAITVKAGVGCASAVINSILGRQSSACCCVIEEDADSASAPTDDALNRTSCC